MIPGNEDLLRELELLRNAANGASGALKGVSASGAGIGGMGLGAGRGGPSPMALGGTFDLQERFSPVASPKKREIKKWAGRLGRVLESGIEGIGDVGQLLLWKALSKIPHVAAVYFGYRAATHLFNKQMADEEMEQTAVKDQLDLARIQMISVHPKTAAESRARVKKTIADELIKRNLGYSVSGTPGQLASGLWGEYLDLAGIDKTAGMRSDIYKAEAQRLRMQQVGSYRREDVNMTQALVDMEAEERKSLITSFIPFMRDYDFTGIVRALSEDKLHEIAEKNLKEYNTKIEEVTSANLEKAMKAFQAGDWQTAQRAKPSRFGDYLDQEAMRNRGRNQARWTMMFAKSRTGD